MISLGQCRNGLIPLIFFGVIMANRNHFHLNDIDPEANFLPSNSCKYYSDENLKEFRSTIADNFSLLHVNVRSMAKNGQNLSNYLTVSESKFSVIALTETWLTASNASLHDLPNYSHVCLLRNDRRGGGVSIHLIKSLTYNERSDLTVMSDNCEILFVEIKMGSANYLIGAIYRPPSANATDFLEELTSTLSKLNSVQCTCYICGDFNLDLTSVNQSPVVQSFMDLLHSFSFLPLIDKPTRVTSQTASLIDNILSNALLVSHTAGILVADISDHYPVFCVSETPNPINGTEIIRYRAFTENNKQSFRQAIFDADWHSILNEPHAQQAYTSFAQILGDAFDSCFPIKERPRTRTDSNPWLTRGIKKSIRQKNKLYCRFRNRPNSHNELIYKRYRYTLDKLIARAKRTYYQQRLIANQHDMKKTWQTLKEVIGKQRCSTTLSSITINDEVCTDPKRIAEEFNVYFANVGADLERQIPPAVTDPREYLTGNFANSIFLAPVSVSEITNCLLRLKNSSAGHDSLQPSIIKLITDIIAGPLTHVLNLCFEQSTFPDELKTANVVPIHKGGDASLFQNYRPISILPVFSKIFERLLYNRLYGFFLEQGVITNSQFGFRKNYSTEMALAYTIDKITSELDSGSSVVGLFLDLKKAFDTVHHDILLKKLNHYGIRGDALTLLENYLLNRNQAVKFNNQLSPLKSYHFGVPQGSILGPLFFLVYINDLKSCLRSTFPVLYADDTNIFISGRDIDTMTVLFNNDLASLGEWLRSNRLSLNLSKTHSMIFSTNRALRDSTLSLLMNGAIIDTVKTTTFLGVKIDNALTWSDHIAHVARKVSQSVGIIKKASYILNRHTLLTLYKSLIMPHLQYCNLIWGNAAKVHLQRLVLLQKRVVRVVNKLGSRDHTGPYFVLDNLLMVPDMYQLSCATFLFKLKFNMYPFFFGNHFQQVFFPVHSHHSATSRSRASNYVPPLRCRTSLRQKTFPSASITILNSKITPYGLFEISQSLKTFKRSFSALIIATYQ